MGVSEIVLKQAGYWLPWVSTSYSRPLKKAKPKGLQP